MKVKWRYRENADSEVATLKVRNLLGIVQDCDGDFTCWEIRQGDNIVDSGRCYENIPYHFDTAKAIVESKLQN